MSQESIPAQGGRRKHRWHRAATLTTLTWKSGQGHERGVLKDWTRMFEPNWQAIAQDISLGKTALRILMLSATVLGKDHIIQLTQKQMAELLGVTPAAIHQAMRGLIREGLVFQNGHTYWLNSRLVAKESPEALAAVRRDEIAWMRAVEEEWQEEGQ